MSDPHNALLGEQASFVPLKELSAISKGKKPSTTSPAQRDECFRPYILIESFDGDHSAFTNDDTCKAVKASDILVVWDGARAGLVSIGHEGYLGSTLASIRVAERANTHFVFYTLQLNEVRLRYLAEGTGVPHLSRQVVDNLPIPNFSPSVQGRISSVLNSIDRAAEDTQKQIYKLQDLKNATMDKLLTEGISHTEFRDSEFGRIPKSWVWLKIGSLGHFFGGLTGKTSKDFGEGEPYLTYLQVFSQRASDRESVGLVRIDKDEKQNRVQFGDILFTTSSETPEEVGMSTVFLEQDWSPYLNSFCFGLRPSPPSSMDPLFAKFLFRSARFRGDILPLAQGSTRFNLSKQSFKQLHLLIPPLPEQKEIAAILSSLDGVIAGKQKKLRQTQSLKKALAQDLLTGKVRVAANG